MILSVEVQNDASIPFCYTWTDIPFEWTENNKRLSCQSDTNYDWRIYVGHDDSHNSRSILLNILRKFKKDE